MSRDKPIGKIPRMPTAVIPGAEHEARLKLLEAGTQALDALTELFQTANSAVRHWTWRESKHDVG